MKGFRETDPRLSRGRGMAMILRALASSMRVVRWVLTACLLAVVIAGCAFYGSQVLEGRRSGRELQQRWDNRTVPSGAEYEVNPGDVAGRIVVTKMRLDSPLVEMANVDDRENLDRGPAHVKGTAMPGRQGNCVIAGHRTTYSRPFWSLEVIGPGDEVVLFDLAGARYVYEVGEVLVVSPKDAEVMNPTPQPGVTLIACHPRYSARYRLVVRAALRRPAAMPGR